MADFFWEDVPQASSVSGACLHARISFLAYLSAAQPAATQTLGCAAGGLQKISFKRPAGV